LTGIIMAAGLSFMFIGFAPFSRAKKGIILSVLIVSIISIPLSLSFINMQKVAVVKKQLLSQQFNIAGQYQQLRNIKVRLGQPIKISADLISSQIPDSKTLLLFEQFLTEQLGSPVAVDLSVRLVTEKHFNKQTKVTVLSHSN